MSEVAGRLAIQAGATHLQKNNGGRGVLLGGVPGVPPAKVVIIGGGTVGTNAAKMAVGLGARVIVIDNNADRLVYLDDIFGSPHRDRPLHRGRDRRRDRPTPTSSSAASCSPVARRRRTSSSAPCSRPCMPGSVLVDVAIDQGGCFETSKPTTHTDPTYVVDGVIHYCVANMPGAVARTSTMALTGAHAALRPRHRQQGLRAGRQGRRGPRPGRQRLPWQAHHPVGGRGPQDEVHAAGQSAGLSTAFGSAAATGRGSPSMPEWSRVRTHVRTRLLPLRDVPPSCRSRLRRSGRPSGGGRRGRLGTAKEHEWAIYSASTSPPVPPAKRRCRLSSSRSSSAPRASAPTTSARR